MSRVNLDEVVISDDRERLDVDLIHRELSQSYWAENIPRSLVETSIQNSLCFASYWQDAQISFARVITDQATFSYLADVFVLKEYAGQGVGKQLMRSIMDDARMQSVRRFTLATRDAHSLYEQFGFESFTEVDRSRFMQIRRVRSYSAG